MSTSAGPVRVQVLGSLPAGGRERLSAAWPEAAFVDGERAGPGQVTAIFAWALRPAQLLRLVLDARGLAWVHTRATGVDGAVLEAAAARGVTLTNGRGGHGAPIAEHVLAMILAHLRRLPELLAAQRAAAWLDPFRVRELRGAAVGVLGLGDLGASTARLLRACGATVLGLRRTAGPAPDADETFAPDRLHDLLARADVLVLALPLTPLTRGMIGARELRALRPGAFLVNVGRGPVVDEDALVAELRSGRLAGAALDVFAEEPLPPASPLWSLPGVIVSPHCADLTPQTDERCLALYLEQIARFRAGRPLANVVDPARGY